MASRKKNKRLIKKLKMLKAKIVPPEEPLSNIWYTNKQAWKKLDISPSTLKRWRNRGKVVASKQGNKVYINEYHLQKLLKDGLQTIILILSALSQCAEGWDGLLAS
ncbi:MAG: helix-turn-helix domain-containing protein [Bacteroidota bacterium]|nr:helix-turn-helix domain-containing protein [Bacteroidota bacterium]